MKKHLVILFLFLSPLLAATEEHVPYLTSECNTLSIVGGVVNVYSGQLVQVDDDLVIEGADPLCFTRYYDGGHNFSSDFGFGFGSSVPQLLSCCYGWQYASMAYLEQRGGSLISFSIKATKGGKWANIGHVATSYYKSGYTNCSQALLNGEPDVMAMVIKDHQPTQKDSRHYYKVDLGNGTKRYYEKYWSHQGAYAFRLFLEKRPNGNIRHFRYKSPWSQRIHKIWTTNGQENLTLNAITFDYQFPKVILSGSDGQKVIYHLVEKDGYAGTFAHNLKMENVAVLDAVACSHRPTLYYDQRKEVLYQNSILQVAKVRAPDKQQLELYYDEQDRVYQVNLIGEPKPLYTIAYNKERREVKDVLGGKKIYTFDATKRLKEVKEESRAHHFTWSSKGQLQCHVIKDLTGKPLIKRSYSYDARGNITKVIVEGTVTDAGAQDQYSVDYTYSAGGYNNLIKEEHGGKLAYLYTYKAQTNLVTSKRTLFDGECKEREFYYYDNNAILVKTISDDGSGEHLNDFSSATYRLETVITPYVTPGSNGLTLPWKIYEYCVDLKSKEKKLIRMKERSYTQGSLLTEEKVFDETSAYRFSDRKEYNAARLLVGESNAVGEKICYGYDASFNLIREEKLDSGRWCCYSYDKHNNLIKKAEHDKNGNVFETHHTYDLMGNCTSTTDRYNKVTKRTYDALSREVCLLDPMGFKEETEYDANNYPSRKVDKNGAVTTLLNNNHGKPLKVGYPDGTIEQFRYNLFGYCIEKIHRDGTSTHYVVDYKGRPTKIQTFSVDGELLKTEEKHYKGKLLIKEIDALGHETAYSYDSACRLVNKQQNKTVTYYSYDALGRLHTTTTADRVEVKEYDLLNRIKEERVEELNGTLRSKVCYSYDINGNVTSKRTYTTLLHFHEVKTEYDSDDLPIKITDPEGNITQICYIHRGSLKKETTDPLGRKTVHTHNARGEVSSIKKYDPVFVLVAESRYGYDGSGNKVTQTEFVYPHHDEARFFTIEAVYDAMGHKISEKQQGQRETKWIYQHGRLKSITQPDGTCLTYSYDPLGRLASLHSNENTIHYLYSYDLNDNLLGVHDLINNTKTTLEYDAHDRLIYECQANGLENRYCYDDLDRLIEYSFDEESFHYYYHAKALTRVSRSHQGVPLYSYSQESNLEGKPLHALLPHGGSIGYHWNKNGRLATIFSPSYVQTNQYDAAGNMTAVTTRDNIGEISCQYDYNALDQLESERGTFSHTYSYDSLYNRTQKDGTPNKIDSFNQLTDDGRSSIFYDANGRRLSDVSGSYCYDALGRLISCTRDDITVVYDYDFSSRCMQKQQTGEPPILYRYQQETEVAAYSQGVCSELRILSRPHSYFAIEHYGTPYSVIRNHRGDTCQLINMQSQVVGSYRYDAFGNFTHEGTVSSPWLFTGQRYDNTLNLHHFLKRYYDSAAGRWLTPDPLGFADGPNLYAYVQNNPLGLVDPYGLFSYEEQRQSHLAFQARIEARGQALQRVFDYSSSTLSHPRVQGSLQAVSGLSEAALGGFAAMSTGGVATPIGFFALAHGMDHFYAGINKMATGVHHDTVTKQALQMAGMSSSWAEATDTGLSVGGSLGSALLVRSAQVANTISFRLPTNHIEKEMDKFNPLRYSREPRTVQDKMALEAAKEGQGKVIINKLQDPKYRGMEKIQLIIKSENNKKSVVHYVRDPKTGILMDFKFKRHSDM